MKKIVSISFVLFSLLTTAQQAKPIADREFWKTNPDLTAVKAEIAKGFDFKEVKGMADPIALAITNDAAPEITKYLIDQPGVDFTHLTVEGRIYLHLAANKSNAEITSYLINKGSDINFLDANGHTALTFAAVQGHLTVDLMKAFLNGGVNINKKYEAKQGANILLLEIPTDKDLIIADFLISKGLTLNVTDDEGNTPFNYAAKLGDVNLMKKLIEKGVKYDEKALIIASQGTYRTANTIEVYLYLVNELKMNPAVLDNKGQNVLHSIARKRDQDAIVKFFLDKGVDVNKMDQEGNTPFINAAGGKSFEIVEMMLPKVKNINAVNAKGESALLNAVKSGSPKSVDLLLNKGANIKIKDKEGNDLAYYLVDSFRTPGSRGGFGGAAALTDSTKPKQDDFGDKLNSLQKSGLNFNAPQKRGNTLYHLAIAKDELIVLKKLAPLNIDVNAKNADGLTVLHKAAMISKNDEILKYLISIGAKKEIVSELNETAYALAKENETLAKNNVSLEFLK
jgi:ankyrin repeat protein